VASDNSAEKAERGHRLTLTAKSNAKKKAAKEKDVELKA